MSAPGGAAPNAPSSPGGAHCYPFPRPAVTVDILLFSDGPSPRVLLIRRGHAPFAGAWALPGGFVDAGETLEQAARRELREETGLGGDEALPTLTQTGAYGDPGRDPRGWTVGIAFAARLDPARVHPQAGDDAREVAWHRLDALPRLAFDHDRIVEDAARQLGVG